MINTRTSRLALFAAALSLGTVPLATAQGWHGHGGDGDVMAIMRQLDLTASQKDQLHALMQQDRQATAGTRDALRAVQQQIETAMFSTGTVTTAQLAPLLQQKEQYQATLDQARLQTAVAARGVLTAAQLSRASSLHQQLASLHAQEHALMAPAATPAE